MMKSHKLRESHMLQSLIFVRIFFWYVTKVTPNTLFSKIGNVRSFRVIKIEITHVTPITYVTVKENSSAYLDFVNPTSYTYFPKSKLKRSRWSIWEITDVTQITLVSLNINMRPVGLPNDEITQVTQITHVTVPNFQR